MVRMLASSHEDSVFLPNKPLPSWDPFGERISGKAPLYPVPGHSTASWPISPLSA